MYKLNKFLAVLFSIIILLISLFGILTVLDIANFKETFKDLSNMFIAYSSIYSTTYIAIFSILVILALVLVSTFKSGEENLKTGVAIAKERGKVYISKETLESIICNVIGKYKEFCNSKVQIIINDNGAYCNVFTYIMPNTELPDLTTKVQENVKDAILKQTTIKIEEVNIKVKGVYEQINKK